MPLWSSITLEKLTGLSFLKSRADILAFNAGVNPDCRVTFVHAAPVAQKTRKAVDCHYRT